MDAPNLVADNLGRRIPHTELLAQLRVKGLEEGFVEIGNRGCGRLAVDRRKRHAAAKQLPIDAVQRRDGPAQVRLETHLLHACWVADVVEQRVEKRDWQICV